MPADGEKGTTGRQSFQYAHKDGVTALAFIDENTLVSGGECASALCARQQRGIRSHIRFLLFKGNDGCICQWMVTH